jgi:hypothetical protein
LRVNGHELCDPCTAVAVFGTCAARLNHRNADPDGCNFLRRNWHAYPHDHTVPYGTAPSGVGADPGTSCQATIASRVGDISPGRGRRKGVEGMDLPQRPRGHGVGTQSTALARIQMGEPRRQKKIHLARRNFFRWAIKCDQAKASPDSIAHSLARQRSVPVRSNWWILNPARIA